MSNLLIPTQIQSIYIPDWEWVSFFFYCSNNRPIILKSKSHPGILIEVILIKEKSVYL